MLLLLLLFSLQGVLFLFCLFFLFFLDGRILSWAGRAGQGMKWAKQASKASKQALLMNDLIRVFMKLDLLGNGAEAYLTL